MVDGMTNLIPMAKIGHIGLYRDPVTLEPVLLQIARGRSERTDDRPDPMLATGGSWR